MEMSEANISRVSLAMLQQNEDMLAAIVENLQLGRLDDCIQHYATLQSNLVMLANELDNFPTDDTDAYQHLDVFPDKIMRDDPLDNFLPFEEISLPPAPIIPSCDDCLQNSDSSYQPVLTASVCRQNREHVLPGNHLSEEHQLESMKVSLVLLARNRLKQGQPTPSISTDSQPPHGSSANSAHHQLAGSSDANAAKRLYKRWTTEENYSILLALCHFGSHIDKILKVFPERNKSQVRHKVQKVLSENPQLPDLSEFLQKTPEGYVPPAALAHLFLDPSLQQSMNSCGDGEMDGVQGISTPHLDHLPAQSPSHLHPMYSNSVPSLHTTIPNAAINFQGQILVERQLDNDFALLLAAAQGITLDTASLSTPSSSSSALPGHQEQSIPATNFQANSMHQQLHSQGVSNLSVRKQGKTAGTTENADSSQMPPPLARKPATNNKNGISSASKATKNSLGKNSSSIVAAVDLTAHQYRPPASPAYSQEATVFTAPLFQQTFHGTVENTHPQPEYYSSDPNLHRQQQPQALQQQLPSIQHMLQRTNHHNQSHHTATYTPNLTEGAGVLLLSSGIPTSSSSSMMGTTAMATPAASHTPVIDPNQLLLSTSLTATALPSTFAATFPATTAAAAAAAAAPGNIINTPHHPQYEYPNHLSGQLVNKPGLTAATKRAQQFQENQRKATLLLERDRLHQLQQQNAAALWSVSAGSSAHAPVALPKQQTHMTSPSLTSTFQYPMLPPSQLPSSHPLMTPTSSSVSPAVSSAQSLLLGDNSLVAAASASANRPAPPFARQGIQRLKQQKQQSLMSSPANIDNSASQHLLAPPPPHNPDSQTDRRGSDQRSETTIEPSSPTDALYLQSLMESPSPHPAHAPRANSNNNKSSSAHGGTLSSSSRGRGPQGSAAQLAMASLRGPSGDPSGTITATSTTTSTTERTAGSSSSSQNQDIGRILPEPEEEGDEDLVPMHLVQSNVGKNKKKAKKSQPQKQGGSANSSSARILTGATTATSATKKKSSAAGSAMSLALASSSVSTSSAPSSSSSAASTARIELTASQLGPPVSTSLGSSNVSGASGSQRGNGQPQPPPQRAFGGIMAHLNNSLNKANNHSRSNGPPNANEGRREGQEGAIGSAPHGHPIPLASEDDSMLLLGDALHEGGGLQGIVLGEELSFL